MPKKFLIVDRSGHVLFSHHPDGYMLGLLWTCVTFVLLLRLVLKESDRNCQKFSKMNFGDKYASARTERGGQFVFSQVCYHLRFEGTYGMRARIRLTRCVDTISRVGCACACAYARLRACV